MKVYAPNNELLFKILKRRKLSLRTLAERMDVSYNTLKKYSSGGWTLPMYEKMLKTLRIKAEQLETEVYEVDREYFVTGHSRG